MQDQPSQSPLQTLHQIRGIMERSGRFLSLSGWSGIWAGATALAAAAIAHRWIAAARLGYFSTGYLRRVLVDEDSGAAAGYWATVGRFVALAGATLAVALAGGLFFTMRKARKDGATIWGPASRQMLVQGALPLLVGGIFALSMLYYGQDYLIAPVCLAFYGLALVNASRHTLGEIRYLGYLEIGLGVVSLALPCYGLLFWTAGFGVLHILYGALMWNKYDRRATA